MSTERIETVIVGGGQAGLATGYHLARQGRPFVILDAGERVGDAWRGRWDSLRLFSPAKFDGLPGLPYPGSAWSFPTRDEFADYLQEYAAWAELPVRTGTAVRRVSFEDGRYTVETDGDQTYQAENVVIAAGYDRLPNLPTFAPELAASTTQIHAHDYRNPGQLQEGPVLVVGAGNSGADIALELMRHPRGVSLRPAPRAGSVACRTAPRPLLRPRHLLPLPPPDDRPHADRPQDPPEGTRARFPADPREVRRPESGRMSSGWHARPAYAKDSRCSPTARHRTSPTSCGARASGRTSPGSTSPCSTRTANRTSIAVWWTRSRACISSAVSSSTRWLHR